MTDPEQVIEANLKFYFALESLDLDLMDEVWATDASDDALDVARANVAGCAATRVRLAPAGSWFDPLPAPLTPQQQADRPYALGTMEIAPVYDLKFKKMSELSTFMLIYNPKTDSANKPDVVVEYNFYQKPAGQPEKFFNKTNPQNLNAQTLPPQFDLAAGHQLQSGQAVPLASFPEGDYRLEIKVTDKIANKTLTRDVNFSVNPS